jgi:hypothetical protein
MIYEKINTRNPKNFKTEKTGSCSHQDPEGPSVLIRKEQSSGRSQKNLLNN